MHSQRKNQGFTLIELSIVLVIIGLIVGGVLVGQDLIRTAEIRSTISQIESYNATANTFRNKYNGLPGDLLNAPNVGMVSAQGSGSAPNVNVLGNAAIEDCAALTTGAYSFSCENDAFWVDLAIAGLVDTSITIPATPPTSNAYKTPRLVSTFSTSAAPAAKMGRGNYVLISYPATAGTGTNLNPNTNYWRLMGVQATAAAAGANVTAAPKMSPTEANAIDGKLDDGVPSTGSVQATDAADGSWAIGTTNGCASSTGLTLYEMSTTPLATAQKCHLAIRVSF